MLHARPPLVLICFLPFPFSFAHLVFSHLLSPFSLRVQMLNVTCIRGPAEAPQENGQKRASVGSPGGQKASSPSIAHTTAANTGFSLSAMFDQGIAAVGGSVGIGVALAIKNGAVVISSIGKGGGADKTGGKIQVNDEIVEIDGKPVEQKLEAVQQKLLGARGSEIKLRLKRYGVFGSQV
jgi:hypothetical protein